MMGNLITVRCLYWNERGKLHAAERVEVHRAAGNETGNRSNCFQSECRRLAMRR
jgi:hypothetical protein